MVVGNKEVDVLSSDQTNALSAPGSQFDLGKAAFRGNYFVKATLIDLVKKSRALGPDYTVETYIGSKVSKLNRPLELKGWNADEKAPAIWLVSYTYNMGEGPAGYYFEVDAKSGNVQTAAGDPGLEKKYGLQCSALLCQPAEPNSAADAVNS